MNVNGDFNKSFYLSIEEVVYQALLSKYDIDRDLLRKKVIKPAIERVKQSDEYIKGSIAGKITDVELDVIRQVKALFVIENNWSKRPDSNIEIDAIHSLVYGKGGGDKNIRVTEYVEDYEGVPPTQLHEIYDKKERINSLLKDIDSFINVRLHDQAEHLAIMYSQIIAAHVYQDGNGRVARTTFQYCLRRWGHGFLPVPKVRNAPIWKKSLHGAVAGAIGPFSEYILSLIEGKSISDVEKLSLDDD